jgi:RNA polymerase sigma-32 factor
MAKPMNLPMIASGEGSLNRYLQDIRKFPMLTPEEEYMFGKAWKEHQDPKAAERMITSHLRLVAKIAMGYRGYGLPVGDVISEGNIGLMHAVKRYDPDRGFKLATYAMWWIKAQIQEFVLRSWSLVKIGTTSSQKKLFFNLRKMKSRIQALEEGDLRPDHVKYIAKNLGVSETDVVSMNRRLMGDASLNAPLRSDADGDGEWQDWLVDDHDSPETVVGNNEEADQRNTMLTSALKSLTEREREVIEARKLRDEPATLEDLSQKFGVSRERIRQIEVRAFEKLQKAVKAAASKALAPKQPALAHAAN